MTLRQTTNKVRRASPPIFAFPSPRPPLGGYTKEMQPNKPTAVGLDYCLPKPQAVRCGACRPCDPAAPRHKENPLEQPEGFLPISPEPSPSDRPWAPRQARPRRGSSNLAWVISPAYLNRSFLL